MRAVPFPRRRAAPQLSDEDVARLRALGYVL